MIPGLPHEGVRVRLGQSAIHGIGVFALDAIPAGANVFPNDRREIVWVSREELERRSLTPFERAFYDDFAIRSGDFLGCPESFDQLSVGWYVNEPAAGDAPNLVTSPEFDLLAARDIAAGEELTIRYATFSEVERAS